MVWEVFLALIGLSLLLAFIFPAQARYYVSFTLYACTVMIGSVYYSIVFIIRGKPTYENSCEFNNVWKTARWFMDLRPKLYGLETYDDKKHVLFAINHQSFIDVLSLADIWRLPSSVIAKNELRYFGPLGIILHYTKVICIRRSDHKTAIAALRATGEQMKKEKVNLFMFPEGTRNDSGKLLPFKKGAFHLAIQAGVPIQPVVISCYNSFLNHKSKTYNRGVTYGVYLLPEISTEGLVEADAGKLSDQTFAAMSEVYDLTVAASQEELAQDLRKKLTPSSD